MFFELVWVYQEAGTKTGLEIQYFGEKGAEIRQEVLQNTPVDREREERRNG